MRILITGCGGPAGRALTRLLDGTGHQVVGADMDPPDPSGPGIVAQLPAASDPAMIDALADLVAAQRIDLLIPTVSDELPAVAAAAASGRLGPVRTAISEPGPVEICHDKLLTARALHATGVAVPVFALPSSVSSSAAARTVLGGPFVIKPRISRGGRGVLVVDGPAEPRALRWSDLDDSRILQEFAPGTEYSPMVHRSADGVLRVVVLEKTGLRQGRIGNATSIRRLAPLEAADVADLAAATVVALGLTGTVDMDVRRTRDGRPVVLEVNARFGANTEHAPELLQAVLDEAALDAAVPDEAVPDEAVLDEADAAPGPTAMIPGGGGALERAGS